MRVQIVELGLPGTADPELLRVRILLTNDEERGRAGAALWGALRLLALPERAHLEFWDSRPPVPQVVSEGGLKTQKWGPSEVATDVPWNEVPRLLDRLAPASFGLWVGMSAESLRELVALDANRARARALPKASAFVIASIYDDNIEVFARIDDPSTRAQLMNGYSAASKVPP